MLTICQFFLLFTREVVILPFFLIGYFFLQEKKFFRALVLVLWAIPLVAFLKFMFKIPLLPHLGEGWSFPSGHMFVSCTFWGFLALETPNKIFRGIIFIILTGISYSLVYCNYHITIDVLAAILFSFIFILFYHHLLLRSFIGRSDILLPFIALLGSSVLIYHIPPYKRIFHLCLGGLIGIILGQLLKLFLPSSSSSSAKNLLICLGGGLFLYLLSPFLANPWIPQPFLLYLLLGFWIIIGPNIATLFFKKK